MKEIFQKRKLDGSFNIKLANGNRWEQDKGELVEQIINVIEDFQNQGYKLTLRQLYYQLVARDYIPNDGVAYKKLSSLLDDCRYSGKVDWDAIEDRGRVPYTPYFENSLEGALKRTLDSYKLDKRLGQPIHLEIWSEKDAISNILRDSAYPHTLTVVINKGFASSTAMYSAYRRFLDKINNGQKVVVLYFGDHDPSGLDMVRDIRERIEFFLTRGEDAQIALDNLGEERFEEFIELIWNSFEVKHIGLTMEQIQEINPPTNPAKITDPRAKNYIAEHGQYSWEVDALTPTQIREIIEEEIELYINKEKLAEVEEREKSERSELRNLINRYKK